jgi:flagellar biosynthesis/type III secretory pathway protein FliH
MSEHLPECWGDDPQDMYPQCICKRLRASEQRVTDDFARKERKAAEYGYEQGYSEKAMNTAFVKGYEQGQREERDRIRQAVEALAISLVNMRLDMYDEDDYRQAVLLSDVLAVIDGSSDE